LIFISDLFKERDFAISPRPLDETIPKLTFLMFLFSLHASKILTNPSSPKSTPLKLNFSIGWSTFSFNASPMNMPAYADKFLLFAKDSLVKFFAPGLEIASFR